MASTTLKYRWQWHLKSTPQALWPAVCRGAEEAWQTFPFAASVVTKGATTEWVSGSSVTSQWSYGTGSLTKVSSRVSLQRGKSGTVVRYDLEVEPSSLASRWTAPFFVVRKVQQYLGEEYSHADAALQKSVKKARREAASQKQKKAIQEGLRKVSEEGFPETTVQGLQQLLFFESAATLHVMRPYVMAEIWMVTKRSALEVFLAATRHHVLQKVWRICCPCCQQWHQDVTSLREIPQKIKCPECDKEVEILLDRDVELFFRPSDTSRTMSFSDKISPMASPHLLLRQTVNAGELMQTPLFLPVGEYFVHTDDAKGGLATFTIGDTPHKEIFLEIDKGIVVAHHEGKEDAVKIHNKTEKPLLLIIEKKNESSLKTSCMEVLTSPYWHKCFSFEAPAAPIKTQTVGLVALQFHLPRTGEKNDDDTAFWKRTQETLALVDNIVRNHEGAVVSRAGGTAVAAFAKPEQAIQAGTAIHHDFGVLNTTLSDTEKTVMKVAVHGGPALVVDNGEGYEFVGHAVRQVHGLLGITNYKDGVVTEKITKAVPGAVRGVVALEGQEIPLHRLK